MNEQEFARKARMLGKEIPRSLIKEGVKSYNPLEEQRDMFQRAVQTGTIRGHVVKRETRRKMESILKSGVMDKKIEKMDNRVADKIDREMEGIVRAKLGRGDFNREEIQRSYHQFMKSVGRK